MMDPAFSTQVKEMAEQRGWFGPDDDEEFQSAIISWVNQETSLEHTINTIVTPINEVYSTPPSEPPTAEGYLWELWYSILETAKMIDWQKTQEQERLLELMASLQKQPNPEKPSEASSWVYSGEGLWNSLSIFGPAARESWNDAPGFGAGFESVEIKAWTNVNAFVARLTKAGIRDFWTYCIWALRNALEDEIVDHKKSHHIQATASTQLDAFVPAACVWVLILGKTLYDKEENRQPQEPGSGNPEKPGKLFGRAGGKSEFSKARWSFWKERLGDLRNQEDLLQDTRDIAAKTYDRMVEIENGTET